MHHLRYTWDEGNTASFALYVDVCVLVRVTIVLFAAYNPNWRHLSTPSHHRRTKEDRRWDSKRYGLGLFACEDCA